MRSKRRFLAGILLPALLAVGCVVSGGPSAEGPAPANVVPLGDFHGRPVVDVMLAGQGPFRFILDTGADVSVIDHALARRLELETIAEEEIGSPLGGTVPAQRMRLSEVDVSGVKLGAIEALAIDLASVIGGGDAPVGVLASATFEGRSLIFDFMQQRLTVSDELLPAANGVDVVDFCAPSGKPSLNVEVGGQRHCVNLDTGSPAVLALPLAAADSLSLDGEPSVRGHARLVGAEVAVWGAQLKGELRAGGLSLDNPELTFHETAPVGNLGQGFLRQAELTVDHANRRLRLRAADSAAETRAAAQPQIRRMVTPQGKKRYGMRFRGSMDADLVVAGVDSGSPAEAGGLLAGDRVLALNGKVLSELGMSERIEALRGSPLRLRVQRDGEQHELALRLE
jgi:hypothetical protein